jgi:hypothetical protein
MSRTPDSTRDGTHGGGIDTAPIKHLIDPLHLDPIEFGYEYTGYADANCAAHSFDVLPYLASLLKCCRVPEKAICSSLFDPLLPFLLSVFGLKLPLAFFLLKFSLPFNAIDIDG